MKANSLCKSIFGRARLLHLTWVLALGLTATQAVAESAASSNAQPDKFTVTLLKGNALSYVPIVAQRTGIWERHGLAVDFVNVTNGPAFVSSIQSGSADGGVSAFTLAVPAYHKGGKKLVAVAGDIGKASYTIVVRPGLEDKVKGDWRQVANGLKGMRFGVPAVGGEVSYVFLGLMQAAGVDPAKDLTVVQAGSFSAAIAALKRGDIDAYIGSVYAQVLGLEERGIAKVVLDLNTAEPFRTWTHTQFFVSEEVIQQRPATVRKVQAALKDTHAWLKDPKNFDEALKLANEIFPVSAPAMKDMISRYRYELDPSAVKANLAFFERAGIITHPVRFEDFVFVD